MRTREYVQDDGALDRRQGVTDAAGMAVLAVALVFEAMVVERAKVLTNKMKFEVRSLISPRPIDDIAQWAAIEIGAHIFAEKTDASVTILVSRR